MIFPLSLGISIFLGLASGSYTSSHTLSTHAILVPTRAASDVGMDLAYAKPVPTLDWHRCCTPAKLVPTLVTARVGMDVATHAKPMPTLGASRVGTNVATCKSCANVDTGGGC